MSLTHDDFTFGNHRHGIVMPQSEWNLPIVSGRFFGVQGVSHIIGETHDRLLICQLTLDGYENLAALKAARNTLDDQIGKLTGTLTCTVSASSDEFPQSTFVGYTPLDTPFFDGSGVHGWVWPLNLMWIQRGRT